MATETRFVADHPRGPNGGPMFLGDELCPICECCSLSSVECENCGGEGVSGHDCGEDTCCCLDPYDDQPCDICEGEGGFQACLGGCDFVSKIPHKRSDEARDSATNNAPIPANTNTQAEQPS